MRAERAAMESEERLLLGVRRGSSGLAAERFLLWASAAARAPTRGPGAGASGSRSAAAATRAKTLRGCLASSSRGFLAGGSSRSLLLRVWAAPGKTFLAAEGGSVDSGRLLSRLGRAAQTMSHWPASFSSRVHWARTSRTRGSSATLVVISSGESKRSDACSCPGLLMICWSADWKRSRDSSTSMSKKLCASSSRADRSSCAQARAFANSIEPAASNAKHMSGWHARMCSHRWYSWFFCFRSSMNAFFRARDSCALRRFASRFALFFASSSSPFTDDEHELADPTDDSDTAAWYICSIAPPPEEPHDTILDAEQRP
mmetsp:Transcript_18382/g.57877  ORF Transcript_18382/g.57877 Transcript_18382/m.57877 type:complete len:316 (-) Transcript_18382:41-988(-)